MLHLQERTHLPAKRKRKRNKIIIKKISAFSLYICIFLFTFAFFCEAAQIRIECPEKIIAGAKFIISIKVFNDSGTLVPEDFIHENFNSVFLMSTTGDNSAFYADEARVANMKNGEVIINAIYTKTGSIQIVGILSELGIITKSNDVQAEPDALHHYKIAQDRGNDSTAFFRFEMAAAYFDKFDNRIMEIDTKALTFDKDNFSIQPEGIADIEKISVKPDKIIFTLVAGKFGNTEFRIIDKKLKTDFECPVINIETGYKNTVLKFLKADTQNYSLYGNITPLTEDKKIYRELNNGFRITLNNDFYVIEHSCVRDFAVLTDAQEISKLRVEKSFEKRRLNKSLLSVDRQNDSVYLYLCFSGKYEISPEMSADGKTYIMDLSQFFISENITNFYLKQFSVLFENSRLHIIPDAGFEIQQMKAGNLKNIIKISFSVRKINGLDTASRDKLKRIIELKKIDGEEIEKIFSFEFDKIRKNKILDKFSN